MPTVLIKVSNALQRIYHEIDSQVIFLNFEAANQYSCILKQRTEGFRCYAKTMLMRRVH